jgi:hypothetical protein
MSYQVNGTVDTPEPNYSHTEPVAPIDIGMIADGGSARVAVGVFKNTGNVTQTVSVAISNMINCQVENVQFVDGFTNLGPTIQLIPNQERQLYATVHAVDLSPADGDQPLSFSVDSTWTH